MPNATEAEGAVNTLNGTDFNGNTLQVRFKSPKVSGCSLFLLVMLYLVVLTLVLPSSYSVVYII